MTHIDRDLVDRVLHGAAAPAEEAHVRAHIETCPECEEIYEDVATEVDELREIFSALEDEAPDVDVDRLIARASRRPGTGWRRWAAGITLAFATAGVAYAAPNSPLPGMLRGLLGGSDVPTATEAPVTTPQTGDQVVAGIVVPMNEALVIDFTEPTLGGRVRVEVDAVRDVRVEVRNGSASFDSDVARLAVSAETGEPEYRVVVPVDGGRLEIRAGSERLWLREAGSVTSDAERDDDGGWMLSLRR